MEYSVTVATLAETLQSAPENTSDTPHIVNIDVVTQTDVNKGTIRTALRNNSTKYVSLNILSASDVTNASSMFHSCTSLTSVDVSGMTAVKYAYKMFTNCTSLESVYASTSVMSSVTSAYNMFDGCSSLTSVSSQIISSMTSVTDAHNMFDGCTSLKSMDVSSMSAVTNARFMFSGCTSLTSVDVSGMSAVTDASEMFYGCSSLVSVNASNMSAVTDASSMFFNCEALTSADVSGMTHLKNAAWMFQMCFSLTSVDVSGLSSVTNAQTMFQECKALTSIDISGMTSVTNATNMFRLCGSLEKITGWAIKQTATMDNTFDRCTSLSKIEVASAVPLPSDTDTWKLCHINQAENSTLSMDIHSLDGTTVKRASDIDISQNNKATLYGRVDEVYLGSRRSNINLDTTIESMLKGQHQLALRSEQNAVDATASNIIMWAKDCDNVVTNLFNRDGSESGSGNVGESESVSVSGNGDIAPIQYAELPKGTEALSGKIYQYVGDTTKFYRNGRFYKCNPSYTPPEGYTCYEVEPDLEYEAEDEDEYVSPHIFLYLKGKPETPTSEDLFVNDDMSSMIPVSDSSRFVPATEFFEEISNVVIDGNSISFTCSYCDCHGNVYDAVNHLDDYWCWTYATTYNTYDSNDEYDAHMFFYALKSQPVSAENLYIDATNWGSLSQSKDRLIKYAPTEISNIRVEDGVLMFYDDNLKEDCVCLPYESYYWSEVVSSALDCEFDQEAIKGSSNLMKSDAIYESITKVNVFTNDYAWNQSSSIISHVAAFNNIMLYGDISNACTTLWDGSSANNLLKNTIGNDKVGAIVASCVHKGQLYFSDGTADGLYKLYTNSIKNGVQLTYKRYANAVDHRTFFTTTQSNEPIIALESFKGKIVFAIADPSSPSQNLYALSEYAQLQLTGDLAKPLSNYDGPAVTCLRKLSDDVLLIGTVQGLYYTKDLSSFYKGSGPSSKIVEISPSFVAPYSNIDTEKHPECLMKAIDSENVSSIFTIQQYSWEHAYYTDDGNISTLIDISISIRDVSSDDKLKGIGCFVPLSDGRIAAANKSVWTFKLNNMNEYELVYDGEADEHEVSSMVVTHDETGKESLVVFKTGKGRMTLTPESSKFVKKLALGENLLKVTLDYVDEYDWSINKSPMDLSYAFTQNIPIHLMLVNQDIGIPITNMNDYTAVASGIIHKDGVNKVVSVVLSGTKDYWESVEIIESELH